MMIQTGCCEFCRVPSFGGELIFYNHWHNGDLFITRDMVSDVTKQLPNMQPSYAHNCNSKVVMDLIDYRQDYISILNSISARTKVAVVKDKFLFNTWVGAWWETWHQESANNNSRFPTYSQYYKIYKYMYEYVNKKYSLNLKIKDSLFDYIPNINYNEYNIQPVKDFVEKHKKVILFSNNDTKSLQSKLGDMKQIIEELALHFKDLAFVATKKFDTHVDNIYFTSDIIQEESDLNEISYLSTLCPVFVGKGSSPATFFHNKENYMNSNKIIIELSIEIKESLPYGLDIPAEFRHSNSVDHKELVDFISSAIKEKYL